MMRILALALLVVGLGSAVVLTQNGTNFTNKASPITVMPVDETTLPPPAQGQCSYEPCCLLGNPRCLMAIRDDVNWCVETSSELAKRCPGVRVTPVPTPSVMPPVHDGCRPCAPGMACPMRFSDGVLSCPEPTITIPPITGQCGYKPCCLMGNPRCLISEQPNQIWCPETSDELVKRCPGVRVTPIPTPTVTPVVTPVDETTLPPSAPGQCAYEPCCLLGNPRCLMAIRDDANWCVETRNELAKRCPNVSEKPIPTQYPKPTDYPQPTSFPTPTEIIVPVAEESSFPVSIFDNFQKIISNPVEFLRGLFKFAD